jgi:16S rRNA processing protein RimM
MERGREQGDWVCIAVVATAHGVRGALRLRTFTETPEDVAAYGPVHDRVGRRLFPLTVIGRAKGGVVVRAEGIEDRDAALALRGTELFVPRAALPALAEDEFYYGDLEGLEAVRPDGSRLGVVRAVENFGAGDLLELIGEDGRSLVLPFDRRTVPEVDLAARRVVVDPPAELLAEPGR